MRAPTLASRYKITLWQYSNPTGHLPRCIIAASHCQDLLAFVVLVQKCLLCIRGAAHSIAVGWQRRCRLSLSSGAGSASRHAPTAMRRKRGYMGLTAFRGHHLYRPPAQGNGQLSRHMCLFSTRADWQPQSAAAVVALQGAPASWKGQPLPGTLRLRPSLADGWSDIVAPVGR